MLETRETLEHPDFKVLLVLRVSQEQPAIGVQRDQREFLEAQDYRGLQGPLVMQVCKVLLVRLEAVDQLDRRGQLVLLELRAQLALLDLKVRLVFKEQLDRKEHLEHLELQVLMGQVGPLDPKDRQGQPDNKGPQGQLA